MTRGTIGWMLIAAGCGDAAGVEGGETGETGSVGEELEAELSLEEVDAVIVEALADGVPEPIAVEGWLWALAEAESAEESPCYRITESGADSSVSWQGSCEHGGGDVVEGTLLISRRDETTAEGDRRMELSYLGSLEGTREGVVWVMGGTGVASLMETAQGVAFHGEIGGTYDLGLDWATGAVDTSLTVDGSPTDLSFTMTLEGGLTTPAQTSLYFWGLQALPDTCPDAPIGHLGVRDPSTGWFDLAFTESCTGCATVTWQGREVGESCTGAALMGALATLQVRFSEPILP